LKPDASELKAIHCPCVPLDSSARERPPAWLISVTQQQAIVPAQRRTQWTWVTGHDLVHNSHRPGGYEGGDPHMLEINLPGISAAGDVRAGSTEEVALAAGQGATAVLLAREHLKTS
jgi:hypothetical protein